MAKLVREAKSANTTSPAGGEGEGGGGDGEGGGGEGEGGGSEGGWSPQLGYRYPPVFAAAT